jgi:uncharacterized protein YbaR (Trm112 family)
MPFAIQIIRCPQCHQPVYHAEEALAAGKKWHKTCFRCGTWLSESMPAFLTDDLLA